MKTQQVRAAANSFIRPKEPSSILTASCLLLEGQDEQTGTGYHALLEKVMMDVAGSQAATRNMLQCCGVAFLVALVLYIGPIATSVCCRAAVRLA